VPDPELQQASYEACRRGEVPEHPAIGMQIPTVMDPSLAPPGFHLATTYGFFFPCEAPREERGKLRDEMAERIIDRLSEFLPTCSVTSPARFTSPAMSTMIACTPVPYMIYSDAVLEPPPGVRHEWWIYSRLAEASGVPMFGKRWLAALLGLNTRLAQSPRAWLRALALTPEKMLSGMLKKAGLPPAKAMARDHPRGIRLPENRGGNYLGTKRLLTGDGKVDLAPAAYLEGFRAKLETLHAEELAQRDAFKLIGKRELRRLNTSSANVSRLVKEATNYANLNPADAAELGVRDGELLAVRSAHGAIRVPVRVSDEMMRRTVAIPQCWGHGDADGLAHAKRHPGVNSNHLAGDGVENVEKLSGMSHLSGIIVELERAGGAA
jgi:anaerobic selenocysteine-containing dehydrogenase